MKIAIDARSLINSPTGIANYLISAINELSDKKPTWKFYLLLNKNVNCDAATKLKKRPNVIFIKTELVNAINYGVLWYRTSICFILKKLEPNFFWAPSGLLPPLIPKKTNTLVTVHDVVPIKYRSTMMLTNLILYSFFFRNSIRKADLLWTVSEYTKKELIALFPHRRCNDIFVGQCFDEHIASQIDKTPDSHHIIKELKIPSKFLLFVGTIEPRKNLKFLLSLVPMLSNFGYSLVVVGATGWNLADIYSITNSKNFPSNRVIFTNFIQSKQLIELYKAADALIIPSINEGFGLPAVEAMANSCPVVAANNSALSEVVKGAGLLITGWNKEDWINGIIQVCNQREYYIKNGLRKLKKYQSSKTIDKLINRFDNFC